MEGFICPDCRAEFSTPGLLQAHFSNHMSEGHALKSMISKAKDYTLNWMGYDDSLQDTVPMATTASNSSSPAMILKDYSEEQKLGRVFNHTKVFRAVRPRKLSHSVKEANKLLIRLEKLVTAVIREMGKKNIKDIEKAVIPWTDDTNDCVSCGQILSIVSRKHHCRLCAGILCTNCSFSIGLEEAVLALGKQVPDNMVEHNFRFCEKCVRIVDSAREEVKAKKIDRTMEVDYQKLIEAREKCEKLMVSYRKVSQSLRKGEAEFTLEKGNLMRVELVKQLKIVDKLSERIAGIQTTSPTQLKVQNNIRQSMRTYLQDSLHTTAPLPELEEIQALQERRQQQQKITEEREKEAALRHQRTIQRSVTPQMTVPADSWNTKSRKEQISRDMQNTSGWSGKMVKPDVKAHPLIEQREILRGYLQQALRDGREEEVETLKQNLHMIVYEINSLGLE